MSYVGSLGATDSTTFTMNGTRWRCPPPSRFESTSPTGCVNDEAQGVPWPALLLGTADPITAAVSTVFKKPVVSSISVTPGNPPTIVVPLIFVAGALLLSGGIVLVARRRRRSRRRR